MNHTSTLGAKRRATTSKILILGLLMLAFGTLSVFGNYVQWAGAVETRAKIVSSKEQLVPRGSNYLKLQVTYDVSGKSAQGEVYVMPGDLDKTVRDGEIDVLYKQKNPTHAIAKTTLENKRKTIPWIFAAGGVLTVFGLYFQFRSKPQQEPETKLDG